MSHDPRVARYNGLQFLRILAAYAVVVSHLSGGIAAALGPGHRIWWSGGKAGVDVFFVISGFVMLYTSAGLETQKDGWRLFAKRRLIRVVPLYWLASALLIGAMVLLPALFRRPASSALYILLSFLFVPARASDGQLLPLLAVGWTLNFEMFFYAVFCVVLLLRKRPLVWVSGIMLGCTVLSLLPVSSQSTASAFYFSPTVLDFVAGMLIATMMVKGIRLPVRWAMPLALASIVALSVTISDGAWEELLKTGLPAVVLVYAVACMEPLFARLPSFFLLLADASYATYLFHIFVLDAVRVRLHTLSRVPVPAIYCSVVAVVAVVSILIRRYVESPLLRRLSAWFSSGATDVRRAGDRVMRQA